MDDGGGCWLCVVVRTVRVCVVRKPPPLSALGHVETAPPAAPVGAEAPRAAAKAGTTVTLHPTWNRPMAPKDLAQFLRVSPTTLRRMAQAGMLPPGIPVGGSVRYMPEEVINHLRQRKPRK